MELKHETPLLPEMLGAFSSSVLLNSDEFTNQLTPRGRWKITETPSACYAAEPFQKPIKKKQRQRIQSLNNLTSSIDSIKIKEDTKRERFIRSILPKTQSKNRKIMRKK